MRGRGPGVRGRLRGGLLLLIALTALIFGGVGVSEVFLSGQRNLHHGVIVAAGHQELRYRSGSGAYQTSETPIVKLQVDDGTTHTVESTPLYNLFNRAGRPLTVQVQLDSYGVPKRIGYHGRWYGAAPPIWFWLIFGLVLLSVGFVLGRRGIRALRRPAHTAAAAAQQASA